MLNKTWIDILIKSKLNALAVTIMLLTIFFAATTVIADDFETTIVSINPSSQTVSSEETFNIDVYCNPGQPIKSFEFKLSFDASLLQVNSVTEGDIFDGYTTFFNSGTINNSAGSIVDIYGLITGTGNVTGNGTFVSISVTAKDVTGTSSIGLYDAGVTNETEYGLLEVNNGTVQVDATAPEFGDNSLSTGHTGDTYTFNVSVTDNIDIASELTVKVDWSHGSLGNNESMTHVGGNYFEKTITLDLSSTSDMTYSIYAKDTCGNDNTMTVASVTVIDNDNPQITDISSTPSPQEIGGCVNITAAITDNIEVGNVFLNITHPDSSFENISITANKTGITYYCNKTYSMIGSYSYFIWADDTSNNGIVSSTHVFAIGDETPPEISKLVIISSDPIDTDSTFGWVNITCDITDNAAVDKVYLNITNPDGSWNNVSMNAVGSDGYYYNSSTAFSQCGNFSYFIWANDTSGSTAISGSHDFSMLPNWDVNNDGSCTVLDLTLISNHYNESGVFGWIREDVDNSGEIKVLDLVLVSNHYDETWWV